ncbi:MAG: hypothetical protein WBF35_08180 [Candidatus Acidiferrales bacterium]
MNASVAGLTSEIEKLMEKYPHLVAVLPAMMDESLKSKTVKLKTDIAIYAPVLAQLAPILKAKGVGDFDPNAEVVEFDTEAVEVSGAPIEDSVFAVPSGYKEAPFADFLQGARAPARTHTGTGGPAGAGMPKQPADAQGVERMPFR